MDETERRKLAERRKKEQKEKELKSNIAEDLNMKKRKAQIRAIAEKDKNKYIEAAVIFLGTLIPLYVFIFCPFWMINFIYGSALSKVGLPIGELVPYLHGFIWLVSAISIYRRESLLDTFFDQFS